MPVLLYLVLTLGGFIAFAWGISHLAGSTDNPLGRWVQDGHFRRRKG